MSRAQEADLMATVPPVTTGRLVVPQGAVFWCVRCWPTATVATHLVNGDSCCEACMRVARTMHEQQEMLAQQEGVGIWPR